MNTNLLHTSNYILNTSNIFNTRKNANLLNNSNYTLNTSNYTATNIKRIDEALN